MCTLRQHICTYLHDWPQKLAKTEALTQIQVAQTAFVFPPPTGQDEGLLVGNLSTEHESQSTHYMGPALPGFPVSWYT